MQYGIRLSKEDIGFGEFCRLLAGLMADTPLGRVVAIRAEKNAERVRKFSEYELNLRRTWREFKAKKQAAISRPGDWDSDIRRLQKGLEQAFSKWG